MPQKDSGSLARQYASKSCIFWHPDEENFFKTRIFRQDAEVVLHKVLS